jgi:hypothetical protein
MIHRVTNSAEDITRYNVLGFLPSGGAAQGERLPADPFHATPGAEPYAVVRPVELRTGARPGTPNASKKALGRACPARFLIETKAHATQTVPRPPGPKTADEDIAANTPQSPKDDAGGVAREGAGDVAAYGAMALRVEKAFGVKMDRFMRMQASYEIAQTRSLTQIRHSWRILV